MKVLSVSAEVFPLVKTGGLADVVGALPAALAAFDVEMRVMVPGYPAIDAALQDATPVHHFADLFGGPATIVSGRAGELDLLVVDAPHLYARPGNLYSGPDGVDWPDNGERFAALSFAAAEVGRGAVAAFVPDLVQCHDWHAALTAAYLHFAGPSAPPTIVTIHNLAFQGIFSGTLFPRLKLPDAAWSIDGVEYYNKVGFLKGGLQYADAITTVSPTYAREICTPAGGMGLEGALSARRGVLTGILNGIDTTVWNPETDPNLAATYGTRTLPRRVANRRAIEARMNLVEGDGLLFCLVSRLTRQKGIDLLVECIDGAVEAGARFAILGTGEPALERLLVAASSHHDGRVAVEIGYDESLAHLLQGGADAVLVPSRFEPCGLTQLYGLRYGCVPVVARVGGLADSIVDANEAALGAGVATGVQFVPDDADALADALARTTALFADPQTWRGFQLRGMKSKVSWQSSAATYAALYRALTAQRTRPLAGEGRLA